MPGRRRLGVEAAVAGPVLGPEDAGLAVEAVDRAPDVRLAEQHAGVVDQVAGGEVVGAVDDQVVGRRRSRIALSESSRSSWWTTSTYGLISPDRVAAPTRPWSGRCRTAVDDLALQVGLVDDVEVDDAERADPGRGEVHQRGRAEAAGADTEHLGVLEPLLPGHRHVGDDQVAGVAADLVDGQLGGGLDQRGQRHVALQGYWCLEGSNACRPGSAVCHSAGRSGGANGQGWRRRSRCPWSAASSPARPRRRVDSSRGGWPRPVADLVVDQVDAVGVDIARRRPRRRCTSGPR